MSTLPGPVRAVFEAAFGDATGRMFLIAAPCAVIALVAVLFIREVPLRTTIEREDELAPAAAGSEPPAGSWSPRRVRAVTAQASGEQHQQPARAEGAHERRGDQRADAARRRPSRCR